MSEFLWRSKLHGTGHAPDMNMKSVRVFDGFGGGIQTAPTMTTEELAEHLLSFPRGTPVLLSVNGQQFVVSKDLVRENAEIAHELVLTIQCPDPA